jgi:phage terminase small subunit
VTTNLRIQVPKKKRDAIKPTVQAALDAGNIQEVIDNLTHRQRRFVEEYLVDFNGAAAVDRAGYNTKYPARLAHEMLAHPGIKAAIDQITLERADEAIIKPEYVINKITRTIEKAEVDNNHSAVLRGCEILARALGMFVERREISGPNGDAVRIEQVQEAADAFTRSINQLIERAGKDESFIVVGPEC